MLNKSSIKKYIFPIVIGTLILGGAVVAFIVLYFTKFAGSKKRKKMTEVERECIRNFLNTVYAKNGYKECIEGENPSDHLNEFVASHSVINMNKLGLNMDDWPQFLYNISFENNVSFIMRNNGLYTIPEFIRQFKNTDTIDLSYNDINYPKKHFLSILPPCRRLILKRNQIDDFEEMGKRELKHAEDIFKSLTYLDISLNNLKKLPNWISKLESLETLLIDSNDFTEFPKELFSLKNLKKLDLSDNKNIKISGNTFSETSFPVLNHVNLIETTIIGSQVWMTSHKAIRSVYVSLIYKSNLFKRNGNKKKIRCKSFYLYKKVQTDFHFDPLDDFIPVERRAFDTRNYC